MAALKTKPQALKALGRLSISERITARQMSTTTRATAAASKNISLPRISALSSAPRTHALPRVPASLRRERSSNANPKPTFYTEEKPGRTALYGLHLQHGGKMVPFGGYSMPVQYSDLSIAQSHAWTREHCSMFDVGHMVQYHVEGPGAEAFLESLSPAALGDLTPGQSTLSALLHPTTGGICDDCIITRLEQGPHHLFYLVLNAGNRQKDFEFLEAALASWDKAMKPPVQLEHLELDGEPFGLIALQGPQAAEILSAVLAPACKVDLSKWYFGSVHHITLNLDSGESMPIVASRGGYTGEDGFELSVPPSQTVEVAEHLLQAGGPDRIRLAGLGARDSLRLEAGMCLYGHDIDDSTTPVEAGLSWIIGKSRRSGDGAKFNGAESVLPQLTTRSKGGAGVDRRRVGLVVEGAPAREGAVILDESGEMIGKVTSGCPSPTLKKNIAMGYVKDGKHKAGTELQVKVRGKSRPAVVTKMPFVPSNYFKG